MSNNLDPSTYLFDVPPLIMEMFCKLMDSGPDSLGWRGLATRILPSWLEVRCSELHAAAGKSPTHELLWSWAQQNKTVADLTRVLEDMGHYRALSLFCCQDSNRNISSPSSEEFSKSHPYNKESSLALNNPINCVLDQGRRQRALITYSEVVEGTGNFRQDLKIEESTFAELYRGRWGNESFIVKVFKQGNKRSWKTLWEKFKTEIGVLQLYEHPNILELWGSFSEGDRYCLVYPFMPNGSLFQRLHNQESERPLSWQERLDIISGTTKAVYHLHTAQPCMVICGNITSSNILLDEHLQPKLSDFGMAHLRPHSIKQSFTITIDTVCHHNLAYLPEEYIRDGKLSVSLDIYSLGMIILETCTGQKVMQVEPKQTLLRDVLSLEVEEKGNVDGCLHFLDSRAGSWPMTQALDLLRLGLACTSSRTRARPSMDTVLEKLNHLSTLLFLQEEQPCTLDDTVAPSISLFDNGPSTSLPVEDDEMERPLFTENSGPHECSQSDVTFLGVEGRILCSTNSCVKPGQKEAATFPNLAMDCDTALDLYSSWPVECSCVAGAEMQGCEDCWANGFINNPSSITAGAGSQAFQSTVENPAKQRLQHKIQLYNQGLLNTEELLSMTLK